ncbi:Maf family protein [Alkalispirochaeta alkalica]|uniref:Maf family protein n=1 Tax=Alkalispirochaeta alkalica TaxID=46356 RepID=UPI00036963E6|nr:Maf family protein [Alkalispirochaeta alkalica]
MNLSIPDNLCITLASASPRRQDLLRRIGVEPLVCPAQVDEESCGPGTIRPDTPPDEVCRQIALERARLKAAAVHPLPPTRLALASDTTVDAGGRLLDKPRSREEARTMLEHLSGITHRVHTAIIVYQDPAAPESWMEEVVTSRVTFTALSGDELEWYLACEEWRDVAGGYRIQGRAGAFVSHLEGSYEAVMGLPIHQVYSTIKRFFTVFRDESRLIQAKES